MTMHLMVWGILALCFSVLFLNIGSSLLVGLDRNATLTGRTGVWSRVLPMVDNPIFGAGFESFWLGKRLLRMRALDTGLNQAHNGYLEVYLNLGWMGLILLGIVIGTSYRTIMIAFRRNPDAASLRIAYFVVALAYNFTEGAFKMRSPVWITFLMMTLAVPEVSSRVARFASDAHTRWLGREEDPPEPSPGEPSAETPASEEPNLSWARSYDPAEAAPTATWR
jgi:O-antigen ligase